MKKKVLAVALCAAIFATSCKKNPPDQIVATAPPLTTSEIKAPAGFSWETSRSVSFTVNITDSRFQNMVHVIAVYDAAPSAGGNLLAQGSASLANAFKSKIYLAKRISEVYIVKTSPDNSTSLQKIPVSNSAVNLSIAE